MSRTVRVHTAHTATYAHPIAAHAGDELQAGRHDDEWPGWVWCTAADGTSGWVPESYLETYGERARLRCDYDAHELTVTSGEELTVEAEVAGWLWCRNSRGARGWIPAACAE